MNKKKLIEKNVFHLDLNHISPLKYAVTYSSDDSRFNQISVYVNVH